MSISTYTVDDLLKDRYEVVWSRTSGPTYRSVLRNSTNGQVIWARDDDLLYSKGLACYQLILSTIPEAKLLNSIFGCGNSDLGRIMTFYNNFDVCTFLSRVIPYLQNIENSLADKFLEYHSLVKDLPSPLLTSKRELYKWGLYMTVVTEIFVSFRKDVKPTSIPEPTTNIGAVTIISLPTIWANEIVKPMEQTFQDWEKEFLILKHPDHKIVVLADGDQIAYIPGFDPCTLIKSEWQNLRPLPDLVPVETKVNESSLTSNNVVMESPEAPTTPDCPLSTIRTRQAKLTGSLTPKNDGLDELRTFLVNDAVAHTDFNRRPLHERELLKKGGLPVFKEQPGLNFLYGMAAKRTKKFVAAFPYGNHTFPNVIQAVLKAFPYADPEAVAFAVANKLVLSKPQFIPSVKDGELYFNRK